VFQQPVGVFESATLGVPAEYGVIPVPVRQVHIGAALDQTLDVLPLIAADESLEEERFVVAIAGVWISTVVQKKTQIAWIFHLGCVDHGVVLTVHPCLQLLGLARVWIGAVFEHGAQPLYTLCAQRPGEQGYPVAFGKLDVWIDALTLHQPTNFLGVAGLAGDGQLKRLSLEVAGCAVRGYWLASNK